MEIQFEHQERYNIAPTQKAPVVLNRQGQRELVGMRWGLIPSWASDAKTNSPLINARAETVHEKPSFNQSYTGKRSLIPADGFIEWQKNKKGKIPYYITLKNKNLFAFAGIWSEWGKNGEALRSYSIITTECNSLLEPIHERMPVILAPSDYDAWLNPLTNPEQLHGLLRPFPSDYMEPRVISAAINSYKNDRAECLAPAPPTWPGELFSSQ